MNRKGFAPILIVLIVAVALVLGGGALYYSKNKSVPPVAVEPPAEALLPTPTPPLVSATPSTGVTAGPALSNVKGWQTYRNLKYGFEIKYPQVFEGHPAKLRADERKDIDGNVNIVNITFGNFGKDVTSAFINFNKRVVEVSIDQWMSSVAEEYGATSSCSKQKIGSYVEAVCRATILEDSGGRATVDKGGASLTRGYLLVTPKGNFESLAYLDDSALVPKTTQDLFFSLADQILSTFKFAK